MTGQRERAAAGKTDGSGRVDIEMGQEVRGVVRPVLERNSCVFGVPDARPVRSDEVDAAFASRRGEQPCGDV